VKQVAFIKHTITTLQMTQFVYNLWQGGSNWYLGFTAYPIILSKMLFWYMISLLALFGNFLVRDKARLAALRAKENGMAQKKKRS
jgi:elongation of very long chain fatty acids protein 4